MATDNDTEEAETREGKQAEKRDAKQSEKRDAKQAEKHDAELAEKHDAEQADKSSDPSQPRGVLTGSRENPLRCNKYGTVSLYRLDP